MEIRLAQDSEGQAILRLFPKWEKMDETEWDKVHPYWAICIIDDEIVAALQICPSLPIGRIEHLNIKEGLNKVSSMKAAHALVKYGEMAMKQLGCSIIAGYVEFRNKPVKRLIQKQYGAQVIGSGSMLVWRI